MNDTMRTLMNSYYARLAKAGHAARCVMRLPEGLEGMRVLDVECRSGKGAFKLADAVGERGYVLGVDADEGNVAAAIEAAPANHAAGPQWRRTLDFKRACPEDLSEAGVNDAVFDVVYVNSALNLAWTLPQALREFARVLAPGGFAWVAGGVLADEALPMDVSDHRRDGNVFAAAPTCAGLKAAALACGFASCTFGPAAPIAPEGAEALPELAGCTFSTCDVRLTVR